jgi:hypothetical protein
MNLLNVKEKLSQVKTLGFQLPNGEMVPGHFHVTEVGRISKRFIDCGGTLRQEEVVSLQLWEADDYDHRLHPEKLVHIIELSQRKLGIEDTLEVEVEYQGATIGKYGLDFDNTHFLLTTKMTDCLAKDLCGVPEAKPKVRLSSLTGEPCCAPDGNCC